ncbi:MAG: GNAT family N-acetyltransferase [Desulfovibrionales bacterium]
MPHPVPLHIETERLRLVAGTKRLATADRPKLARLLGADVTQSWPPPLMQDVEPVWAERLQENPDLAGWLHWYIVLKDLAGDEDVLIGSAGFNGLDEATGTLLMGFSILPAFQGMEYAPEAAFALLEWAFARPGVERVAARTLPDQTRSVRVLEKIGMRRVTDPADPYFEAADDEAGALLYAVTRSDLEE